MSFEGTKAVIIKDLSGNTLQVVGGSLSATASVSGQTIRIANSSGFNAVYITSQSGNIPIAVDNSGRISVNNPITYVAVHAPATLVVTGASGGVALASGQSDFVTITNIGLSGNAVFIGTSGNPPFAATIQSGLGLRTHNYGTFVSPPSVTVPTLGNTNNIRVVASISGEPISYLGIR